MGTCDHLRGVGTAGSMFKTSRLVAFRDRLVGSPPKRTFNVLLGSWKSPLPLSAFSCLSYHEEAVGLESPWVLTGVGSTTRWYDCPPGATVTSLSASL
jgi:hypothetical protein